MRQKLIYLIADGMGDYPLAELNGQTPIEAASTPNIDTLAAKSLIGQCQTIPQGMQPGSDIANMGLLGYDPRTYHTGRGPIEAVAQGLKLEENDLVFRLNLCTVSEFSSQGKMLDYCAGHISTEEAHDLLAFLTKGLNNNCPFQIIPGFQYRHLLLRKGGVQEKEAQLHLNPPHDILEKSLAQDINSFSQSPQLFDLLNKAATVLKAEENKTRANTLWPWGQGKALHLPSFLEVFGYSGAIISAVDLVKGLGKAAGMEVIDVPGATGLLDTNYQGKAEAAQEFLEHGDFLYLHLEAPDECGHAGNYRDKIESIENFDQYIVGPMLPFIEKHQAACLIACDHLTPVALRTHTSEPVPFLFYNSRHLCSNQQSTYNEVQADRKSLYLGSGYQLMQWIMDQLGDKK